MRRGFALALCAVVFSTVPLRARYLPEWIADAALDEERAQEALRRVERGWAEVDSEPSDGPALWSDSLSAPEIRLFLKYDPDILGPMAIGRPNRGALFNGVQLRASEGISVVDPKHAWGTAETVDALIRAVAMVRSEFPNAPPLHIGHISSPRGGWLRPHRSHQSGRDADVGYYYLDGPKWYVRATAQNLDLPKTWVLVRALIVDQSAEYLFIDRTIQTLLRTYAETLGEDPEWLGEIFDGTPKKPNVIRHTWGHLTHMHVRLRSPDAERAGARAHAELVRARLIAPRRYY